MFFRSLIVVLFLGRCSLPLFAEHYSFKTYGHEEGLGGLVVQNILRDSQGFLGLTRRIREVEGTERRVLVIATTARALEGDLERCLATEMDDCLTKTDRVR